MDSRHRLVAALVAASSAWFFACGVGEIGPAPAGAGGEGPASTSRGASTSKSSSASTGGHHDAGPHEDAGAGGSGGSEPDASDAAAGRDLSTDRAKFFGDSRCAGADVLLCEDFESGVLDTTIWTVVGDAPVVESALAARGTHALHVKKHGNGASYIRESKTFPVANDAYYGRMFVQFVTLPSAPGMSYAHWTFAAATGTGAHGEIRLSGQLSNGKNLFGVGTDTGTDPAGSGDWTTSDDDPTGAPRAVPTGEWQCIEWLHKGDTNETRFYWDAVEHPSLATTPSIHGGNDNPYVLPAFTSAWVGWQEYQDSSEDFELWIDEIIIDKERIGCVL